MTVRVIGGTGTIGRPAAAQLARRGHEARVLSRHPPDHEEQFSHRRVDLATGEGLPKALAGIEIVVDASNSSRPGRGMPEVLIGGTRRRLAADAEMGVADHVLISIGGIEHVPFSC